MAHGEWFQLQECVWEGPDCLLRTPRLAEYYPDNKVFLCDKLGLQNTSLSTIVREAQRIAKPDSLDYIRDVFVKLGHMVEGSRWQELKDAGFYDLAQLNIFPVWTGAPGPKYDDLAPLDPRIWYIADTPHLLNSFAGRTGLLAFPPPTLEQMSGFIKELFLDDWQLSKISTRKSVAKGTQGFHAAYTASLVEKARYIAR